MGAMKKQKDITIGMRRWKHTKCLCVLYGGQKADALGEDEALWCVAHIFLKGHLPPNWTTTKTKAHK
jgi:hypothetical protein